MRRETDQLDVRLLPRYEFTHFVVETQPRLDCLEKRLQTALFALLSDINGLPPSVTRDSRTTVKTWNRWKTYSQQHHHGAQHEAREHEMYGQSYSCKHGTYPTALFRRGAAQIQLSNTHGWDGVRGHAVIAAGGM